MERILADIDAYRGNAMGHKPPPAPQNRLVETFAFHLPAKAMLEPLFLGNVAATTQTNSRR